MSHKLHNILFLIICLLLITGSNEEAFCGAPPPKRIVSLAPAITETLFSLGLGDRVVGVTNVCDRPAEARKRPKVGGMTNPSLESILALKPDIVVMTREGNTKEVADRLIKLGIRVHIFSAGRLADLPPAIRELGKVLGAGEPAGVLAANIEAVIRETGLGRAAKGGGRKALFVISPSPLVVVGQGTIIADAMALCGLKNIAADANSPYPQISMEVVILRQPEIIIFGSVLGMNNESEGLLKRLKMVNAVRSGRICYVGDSIYRPGPRIPEGIAELEQCANMR